MATFTPPTHTEYFAGPGQDRLWSRVSYQRGNAVLVNTDTFPTVTPQGPEGAFVVDSDALIAAEVVFKDGVAQEVDTDMEQLLADNGYGTAILLDDDFWIFQWL